MTPRGRQYYPHFISKQKDGLDLNSSVFPTLPVLLSCWEGIFRRSDQLTSSFNSIFMSLTTSSCTHCDSSGPHSFLLPAWAHQLQPYTGLCDYSSLRTGLTMPFYCPVSFSSSPYPVLWSPRYWTWASVPAHKSAWRVCALPTASCTCMLLFCSPWPKIRICACLNLFFKA